MADQHEEVEIGSLERQYTKAGGNNKENMWGGAVMMS